MSTKKKRKGNSLKESRSQPRGIASPPSVTSRVNREKKKEEVCNRSEQKTSRIKAIVLMSIALFFFVYMIYSGGSTGGYLSLVIGLVCGLFGVLHLREGKKGG